jgi:predicted amidophosphoribosyltransferase
MKCPRCQSDNPENKKFCRECAARLVLTCPKCGAEVLHKQQGNTEQARECLTKALEIFERLGTLIEPDKVREELADL